MVTMVVCRGAQGLEVAAPAKLNLLLEVLAKRDDGFHEVETLMAPVALYDTLSIEPAHDDAIRLTCRFGASHVALDDRCPADDSNLAVRALRLLRDRAGTTAGTHLTLVKRIPMAAGLAGGSSDAAAALLLGNELWQLGWSRERLANIAADLGSDVPFFLGSGAAICRGRGERIEPVAGLGNLQFVVVKPPVGLSTAEVYVRCRPASSPQRAQPLVAALAAGATNRIRHLFHNQLQAAARQLTPWIDRLAAEFNHVDCVAHQMSGSGTSYFGLCRSARQARWIATRLRSRGVGQVFAVGACH